MIRELERLFETSEGGRGQGVVRFQPISGMNAVMAVARNPKMLARATEWVRRLDREDTTGTTVRVYHLEYGNAPRVAKILNEIFVGRSGTSGGDTPASQIAPGTNATQSRLHSLGSGTFDRGTAGSSSSSQTTGTNSGTTSSGSRSSAVSGRIRCLLGQEGIRTRIRLRRPPERPAGAFPEACS